MIWTILFVILGLLTTVFVVTMLLIFYAVGKASEAEEKCRELYEGCNESVFDGCIEKDQEDFKGEIKIIITKQELDTLEKIKDRCCNNPHCKNCYLEQPFCRETPEDWNLEELKKLINKDPEIKLGEIK